MARSPAPSLTAFLIGDAARDEFRGVRPVLEAHVPTSVLASVGEAIGRVEQSQFPDLIVVLHARPGEHPRADLARLAAAAPLARMIAVVGSWCGGETRTGDPWPGAVRIAWHDWLLQAARNLARLARGETAEWTLAPTTADEERLLSGAAVARSGAADLVVLCARHFAAADALAAACELRGNATLWRRPFEPMLVRGPAAAVWDGRLWEASDPRAAELAELRWLAGELPGVPIVALAEFPRREHEQQAIAAGAAALLPKPLLLDDLLEQLERLIQRTHGREQAA